MRAARLVAMAGTFTIYDIGFLASLPDRSTPARKAAVALEDLIRWDANETGAFIAPDGTLILQRTGMPNQVSFTTHELSATRGTLFTHNHPGDNTFSREDVVSAIALQLIELRAVGPTLRYTMQAAGGWPPIAALDRAIISSAPAAQFSTSSQINSGQLDPRNAQSEIGHQLWREIARKLSLRYEREKS